MLSLSSSPTSSLLMEENQMRIIDYPSDDSCWGGMVVADLEEGGNSSCPLTVTILPPPQRYHAVVEEQQQHRTQSKPSSIESKEAPKQKKSSKKGATSTSTSPKSMLGGGVFARVTALTGGPPSPVVRTRSAENPSSPVSSSLDTESYVSLKPRLSSAPPPPTSAPLSPTTIRKELGKTLKPIRRKKPKRARRYECLSFMSRSCPSLNASEDCLPPIKEAAVE